jgi:hypothetical protein
MKKVVDLSSIFIRYEVCERGNLNFETDVIGMGTGEPFYGFKVDNETVYDYILKNQNATQNAVIFTSGKLIMTTSVKIQHMIPSISHPTAVFFLKM